VPLYHFLAQEYARYEEIDHGRHCQSIRPRRSPSGRPRRNPECPGRSAARSDSRNPLIARQMRTRPRERRGPATTTAARSTQPPWSEGRDVSSDQVPNVLSVPQRGSAFPEVGRDVAVVPAA